jgi:hypothetical protein
MAKRNRGHMNGERYCGNTDKKEVHDLDKEHTNCQIDEIIVAGHDKPSTPWRLLTQKATTIATGAWEVRLDSFVPSRCQFLHT